MRKNIHKKSETRPIQKHAAQNCTKQKNHQVKNQTQNSSCYDADEFYLTYIYMFICATANKNYSTKKDINKAAINPTIKSEPNIIPTNCQTNFKTLDIKTLLKNHDQHIKI